MRRSMWFFKILTTVIALTSYYKMEAQNFWSPVSGPYGGIIYSVLVANDGSYYVGTAKANGSGGEIFRKSPVGNVWQKVMESGVILSLYQSTDGKLYAGADNGVIMTSTDGMKWSEISAGLGNNPAGDLTPTVRTIIEADNGDILAGTSQGVYQMTLDVDNNVLWKRVTRFDQYLFALKKDSKNGLLYAACFSGVIFKSTDNGQSWTGISPSRLEDGYMDVIFDIDINDSGDVYAATFTGLFVNRATDNTIWASVAKSKIPSTVKKVAIINGTHVYISQQVGGALSSDDDGATWKTTSLAGLNVNAGFVYDNIQNKILAGSFNGVWLSDVATSSFTQIGLPENITFTGSFQPKAFVFVDNAVLYETPDIGATWNKVYATTEGTITAYVARPDGENFIAQKVGISNIPSVSYQSAPGALRLEVGFPPDVQNIKDILLTRQDTILVATDAGLYYINSKALASIKLSAPGDKVIISSLKETPSSALLYAGTSDGVYISNDHGLTWTIHLLAGIQVNEIALSAASEIFAATDVGLFYFSSEYALPATPDPINNLNPDQRFVSVAVDDYGSIYTICDDGVYYTDDFNSLWQIAIDGADNFKYARLNVFCNVAYLATDYGLFKHQPDGVAPVLITGNTVVYDGKQHGVVVTTEPVNLPVTITYNDLPASPSNAGKYLVKATINDPSYKGGAYANLIISKAQQAITFATIANKVTSDKAFALQASTDSQLPVTFTVVSGPAIVAGNVLTLTGGVGVVNVKAEQAGNNNYIPAIAVNRNFEVSKDDTPPDTGPVTGLEEPGSSVLTVYPVPAHSVVIIESKSDKIYSIEITDMLGRTLDTLYPDDTFRHEIDVSGYPEGLVVFNVVTTKSTVAKRVSIKR